MILQLSVCVDTSIDYYEYVSALFQEVDFKIDEELLVGLIKFYQLVMNFIQKRKKVAEEIQR